MGHERLAPGKQTQYDARHADDGAPPAGSAPGRRTLTEQLEPAAPFEIVRDRPAAVVGEPAIFSIPGAEAYAKPGARYACTWTVYFEDGRVLALRPTPHWGQPYVTLNFETPGTHRVTCDVAWDGKAKPPARPQYALETTVTTRRLEDISRTAQARVAALPTPPTAAKHVPIVATLADRKTGEAYRLDMTIENTTSNVGPTTGPATSGPAMPPGAGRASSAGPAPASVGPATQKGFALVDRTKGASRSAYAGDTAAAAVADLRSGNSYPAGILALEIPANSSDVTPMTASFPTTGMSNLQEWAHALGLVSVGAAAVATVFTGGLAAPLLVVASTATAAASAGLTLADDLRRSSVDTKTVAIDIVLLAAAIVPVVGTVARGAGRWVALGQLGLDGVAGVMMTVDAYEALAKELAKPEMQGPDREARIAVFLATLVQSAAIVGISAKQARVAKPKPGAKPSAHDEMVAGLDAEARGAAAGMATSFDAHRVAAERRLQSGHGRDWLGDFAAHRDQIVVRTGEVSVQLVKDLTLVANREVGLFRMMDGRRVLTLGGAHETLRPDGPVRRLVLHSHPTSGPHFSEDDVMYLMNVVNGGKGQRESIIVTPPKPGDGGGAQRLSVDDARAGLHTDAKPWLAAR